jgi:predicted RNA-binding Zn-ribbon protein involved in translation (DUF1610 family)
MDSTQLATPLLCTQCGGELHPDEGQIFLSCPYCSSTVYIDKARVVYHWYLRPTLTEEQATAALARWMSGASTVKDLDKHSQIVSREFQYFPLWYFKAAQGAQKESLHLEPAAATSVTELTRMSLPAGDLVQYDDSVQAQAVMPSVPLEAALAWLKEQESAATPSESALVHVPIYIMKYVFNGTTYTAVIEAATGAVLANLFPAKAEAPYLAIALVTAAVYLCLALAPVIASLSGGDAAFSTAGIVLLIGLIAAPFLFAAAVWVAAKV